MGPTAANRRPLFIVFVLLHATATLGSPLATLRSLQQPTPRSRRVSLATSAASLQPGTPAVAPSSGSTRLGASGSSDAQGNYGWLYPVLADVRRGNCVVYEAKGSESLSDVARLFGLSEARLLADNQGVISEAGQALGGKSLLLCGQYGQAAPRPVSQSRADKADAAAAYMEEAGPSSPRVSRKASMSTPAPPAVPPKEQEAALLQLKKVLDPQNSVLKDWAPTQVAPESRVSITSHCTWTYVSCDDNNNVIRLNMVYLGLEGRLPPASLLARLPNLAELYLGGNQLTGTLPADWATSSRLTHLYLNDNQLTGSLPAEWGNMRTLKVLSVPYNQLMGVLPLSWSKLANLQDVKLNNNQLAGSIPTAWTSMDSLSTITLWNNPQLSGCIPSAWAAKGSTGKGFFQSPTGALSDDIKVATMGTALTGYCSAAARGSAPAAASPAPAAKPGSERTTGSSNRTATSERTIGSSNKTATGERTTASSDKTGTDQEAPSASPASSSKTAAPSPSPAIGSGRNASTQQDSTDAQSGSSAAPPTAAAKGSKGTATIDAPPKANATRNGSGGAPAAESAAARPSESP